LVRERQAMPARMIEEHSCITRTSPTVPSAPVGGLSSFIMGSIGQCSDPTAASASPRSSVKIAPNNVAPSFMDTAPGFGPCRSHAPAPTSQPDGLLGSDSGFAFNGRRTNAEHHADAAIQPKAAIDVAQQKGGAGGDQFGPDLGSQTGQWLCHQPSDAG